MITSRRLQSLEELAAAQNEPIDYIGIGSVYPTQKGRQRQTRGPEGLRKSVKASKIHLVGIAGIDQSNAQDVVAFGVEGVAVVSAICSAPYPKQTAANLLEAVVKGKALARK